MADISMNYFSLSMGRYVTLKIMLPFDMESEMGYKGPYRTLYFLPGYSANAQSIVSTTILADLASVKGFAVVIPDGENSFYTNQEDINAFYEKFAAEEMISVTRRLFPLSCERKDTYIGGISMGGFGCLMLGSRHPEQFGKIIALSPAVDPYYPKLRQAGFTTVMLDRYLKGEEYYRQNYDPFHNFKQLKQEGKEIPQIYMCCGEQDPLCYEMDCIFTHQMEEEKIQMKTEWGDGVHDTKYWNTMLPSAIDFMVEGQKAEPVL